MAGQTREATTDERRRRALDIDPSADIFADRDGRIRAWGGAWTDAFGYSAEEAVGHSLDLIIPEALQPLHWRGFTRAMRKGRLRRPGATLRVPAVHKDGLIFPVVFAGGTPIFSEDGAVEGVKLSFVRRDPEWVGAIYRLVLTLVAAGKWTADRLSRSSRASRSA